MTPATFVRALFDPDDIIEVRPIRDEKGGKPDYKARHWYNGPEELVADLDRLIHWGRSTRTAVFFGVLPRTEHGGGTKDYTRTGRVVWVDIDFKDYGGGETEARTRLQAFPVDPSIVVKSGHGVHAYWFLSEYQPAATLEAASKTIATELGADACYDSARILRLPGSWNQKDPDQPVQAHVETSNPVGLYRLADLLEGLDIVPSTSQNRKRPEAWDVDRGELSDVLRQLIDNSPQLRDLRAGRGRPEQTEDGKKLDITASGYDYAYVGALLRAGVTADADLSVALADRIRLGGRQERDDYIRRTVENVKARRAEWAHRKRPPTAAAGVWDQLKLNRNGNPDGSLLNGRRILEHTDPPCGRLWWNEFTYEVMAGSSAITDVDETNVSIWMDETYNVKLSPNAIHAVAAAVAHTRSTHPVRDYLDGLTWDQTGRASTFLRDYFGAEDNELNAVLGRCWLTSAVARIYEPGCKVDTVLILYGGQGVGKSTVLQALSVRPEWFNDSGIDLRKTDAYGALQGTWVYEMAELDSMRKSDTEAVKAFLTSRTDRYRPAYGRNWVARPRGGVVVGTTNRQSFLSDSTGNRRFWPVSVGEIDLEAVRRDAPMLWAEAVQWYKGGTPWWLSAEEQLELAQMQEAHTSSDGWEPAVADWLARQHAPFTVTDALVKCIEKDLGSIHGGDTARMTRILQAAGCTSLGRRRIQGRRGRWWRAPAEVIEMVEDDY